MIDDENKYILVKKSQNKKKHDILAVVNCCSTPNHKLVNGYKIAQEDQKGGILDSRISDIFGRKDKFSYHQDKCTKYSEYIWKPNIKLASGIDLNFPLNL